MQNQHLYSFENEGQEPDPYYDQRRIPSRKQLPQQYQSPSQQVNQPPYQSPPRQTQQQYHSPPNPAANPAAHPESSFNRLRAARNYSQDRNPEQIPLQGYVSPVSPPRLTTSPPHRDAEGRLWGRELGYADRDSNPYDIVTPGADNFSEQASGGLAGIARGVADAHARESGLEAMRNTPGYDPRMEQTGFDPRQQGGEPSQTSLTPLGAAAFPPGRSTPQTRSTTSRSPHSFIHEPYADVPYNRYSRNMDPSLGEVDPSSIEDDGDEGLEYRHNNRGSLLSLGNHSDRNVLAGAGAAVTGGVLGGLLGKRAATGSGPQYNPVTEYAGAGGNNYDLGKGEEKSEWLNKQSTGSKKLRWIVGIVVAFLIIGGIAGGVVGGILSKKNSSSQVSGQSASADTASNGDLNKNSAEIQALLNNKNLHKVFPGIDYTPMYTQYPGCLTYPASQNNVTRDLAVLSQLTNTIRLYGTDCNQTELLLHSIDQLELNGTVKVWLGVWQDNNATTNARQLAQMYDIFKKYGAAPFVGVIVGNEVLFRKDMTAEQLGTIISEVRTNLTAIGINLPVASSDLGDNWTAELANEVDYLMANIHPFFAGVTAEVAASWTYDFWTTHDTILKADISKNIISETGWPSQGGTDCGGAATCTTGSVAGITEMNTFMGDWVCQALANGTNYFWFEAFDEPWKIQFDTPGEEWEDHWGLMDVNRNLKPGVTIPSCGGKTVT
ncbi:glycoside hydrolase family 17 protein [Hyaloscypha hepaticicola]|uniref:glucan endo-1,3-beta-D-glucosidase n=1 Tax=Hyaloscypha hepaticicola TaxID=2082293 RepID=A0A2J6PJW6_9HELO|nr:glycoside hydrolase family 17 protein [Hyaloscypha hepaticicola]